LRYFRNVFFEPDGKPRYYHNKTYPVDIQCASQAIETLAFCSDDEPSCLELSRKVAGWTIDNMQHQTGYFYFRQYPIIKAKTPYIHWGQATMFKALASLLSKMESWKESIGEILKPGGDTGGKIPQYVQVFKDNVVARLVRQELTNEVYPPPLVPPWQDSAWGRQINAVCYWATRGFWGGWGMLEIEPVTRGCG